MVTLVPARAASRVGVGELLARCLDEGDADARQVRADRLLAALADAGLVLTARGGPAVPA